MAKHTKTARTDNQTANEEQAKVAGVLHGDSSTYVDAGVDNLSGTEKDEFNWGETVHPDEPRVQDTF